MQKRKTAEASAVELRKAAEQRLEKSSENAQAARSDAELLHELQVHQIELEMQNETLRQAQIALEESRDRYVDFYDFAPVGYLTLNEQGLITELNLAGADMMGAARAKLLKSRFSPSIAAEDRDTWHQHFISAIRNDAKLKCEVALLRPDGTRIEVLLDSLRLAKEGGIPVLRVVLIDISARKEAEQRLLEMTAGLEEQVDARTRELRSLSAQLTTTEERERRLLAQDLHDNLGQLLAVIKIKLTSLAAGELQQSVTEIMDMLGQAEQSARTLTFQLSPPILQTLGFVPALEWLADEMERIYGVVVHVDNDSCRRQLGEEVQAMLYRSVRELLINVAKHAGVGVANLSCLCSEERLTVVVSDDGCGFDPGNNAGALLVTWGFGLNSIYERIANIGGEMEIDSSVGNGTTITLTVPCSISEEERACDPDYSCR